MPSSPRLALPLAALLCVLPWQACAQSASGDYWQVRSHGSGAGRSIESTSVINTGKPRRANDVPPATLPLQARSGRSHKVEVFADATTLAALRAPGVDVSVEMDKALLWLGRLATPQRPAAHVRLHLVTPEESIRFARRHPATQATVVELMVPVAVDAAPHARSAKVGRALATALHEAAHALDAGSGRSRADDEYRASLVAACYVIDTLRPGDTLQLNALAGPVGGESFISAHSRQAATRVVDDLAKAAGSRRVAWHDRTAMMGLNLFCGAGLGAMSTSG